MEHPIRFRCPHCQARIKAPVQLIGRQRNCPSCSEVFKVRPIAPEDAGPRVVLRLRPEYAR